MIEQRLYTPLSGDPEVQKMIDALIPPGRQKSWWTAEEIYSPTKVGQDARDALERKVYVPNASEFYGKYGAYGAEIILASLRNTRQP